MNLTVKQNTQWNLLSSVFNALVTANANEEVIRSAVTGHIETFEKMTENGYCVKMHFGDAPSIGLVDRRRDSMKVGTDGKKSRYISARVEGIAFRISHAYEGSYFFTNVQIADALETLASAFRSAPEEASSFNEPTNISAWLGAEMEGRGLQDDDLDDAGSNLPQHPEGDQSPEGGSEGGDLVLSLSNAKN